MLKAVEEVSSGGTVTGVTGTAPIVSSGGTAPVISISTTPSFASVAVSGATAPNDGIYLKAGSTVAISSISAPVAQFNNPPSAVDYFAFGGSATGNPAILTVTATGSDSNIGINLISKGSGTIQINGVVVPAVNSTNTFSTSQIYSSGIYLSGGAAEEAVYSNGNSGTSLAVNLNNGNLQSVTITGAVVITQTTPTHPGKYTLVITQDGTGHVYSLSGIKFAGGVAPAYSTAASKIDVISIIYDGSNYYGSGNIAFS